MYNQRETYNYNQRDTIASSYPDDLNDSQRYTYMTNADTKKVLNNPFGFRKDSNEIASSSTAIPNNNISNNNKELNKMRPPNFGGGVYDQPVENPYGGYDYKSNYFQNNAPGPSGKNNINQPYPVEDYQNRVTSGPRDSNLSDTLDLQPNDSVNSYAGDFKFSTGSDYGIVNNLNIHNPQPDKKQTNYNQDPRLPIIQEQISRNEEFDASNMSKTLNKPKLEDDSEVENILKKYTPLYFQSLNTEQMPFYYPEQPENKINNDQVKVVYANNPNPIQNDPNFGMLTKQPQQHHNEELKKSSPSFPNHGSNNNNNPVGFNRVIQTNYDYDQKDIYTTNQVPVSYASGSIQNETSDFPRDTYFNLFYNGNPSMATPEYAHNSQPYNFQAKNPQPNDNIISNNKITNVINPENKYEPPKKQQPQQQYQHPEPQQQQPQQLQQQPQQLKQPQQQPQQPLQSQQPQQQQESSYDQNNSSSGLNYNPNEFAVKFKIPAIEQFKELSNVPQVIDDDDNQPYEDMYITNLKPNQHAVDKPKSAVIEIKPKNEQPEKTLTDQYIIPDDKDNKGPSLDDSVPERSNPNAKFTKPSNLLLTPPISTTQSNVASPTMLYKNGKLTMMNQPTGNEFKRIKNVNTIISADLGDSLPTTQGSNSVYNPNNKKNGVNDDDMGDDLAQHRVSRKYMEISNRSETPNKSIGRTKKGAFMNKSNLNEEDGYSKLTRENLSVYQSLYTTVDPLTKFKMQNKQEPGDYLKEATSVRSLALDSPSTFFNKKNDTETQSKISVKPKDVSQSMMWDLSNSAMLKHSMISANNGNAGGVEIKKVPVIEYCFSKYGGRNARKF